MPNNSLFPPRNWMLGQLLRIGHGQAAQADRVKKLKDGGIGADAERQRADGGKRKRRVFAEDAKREAEVLPDGIIHGGAPPLHPRLRRGGREHSMPEWPPRSTAQTRRRR